MPVRQHCLSVLVLLLLVVHVGALEGTKLEVGKDTPLIGNSPMGYLAYLPPGYYSDTTTKWPLWIFVEGLGEGGPGTVAGLLSPNNGVVRHGPMRELWRPWAGNGNYDWATPHDYPMIVMSPQAGEASNGYRGVMDIAKLDQFLTAMLSTYRIDPDRVVLTGMSTGGGDTVFYTSYRAANARRLAGCISMVGTKNYPTDGSGPAAAANLSLTNMWLMTAFDDLGGGGTVYTTYAWSNAIAKALGAPDAPKAENIYPYSPGGTVASPYHQNASLNAAKSWTWRQGTTPDRRGDGAFLTDDSSQLMLGMYRNGGHGIWQDAINNPAVLNWIITRQRQLPFAGTPVLIPGLVQAETFDRGGPGRGFNEMTPGNQGNSAFRQRILPQWSRSAPTNELIYANTAVNEAVEVSEQAGQIYAVLDPKEWLAYASDAAMSGSYSVTLRASSTAGAVVRLLWDEVDVTGPITVPATGGEASFADLVRSVTLIEGKKLLKLLVSSGTVSVDSLAFSLPVQRQRVVIDNVPVQDPGTAAAPITITSDRFTASGWSGFSYATGSYGTNCLSAAAGTLSATASYRPHLLYTGDYAVDAWYPPVAAPNSSTQVPVKVISALGTTAITLNERINGGTWYRLGVFPFNRGVNGAVLIGGAPDSFARADAVRFTPMISMPVPAFASSAPVQGANATLSANASFQGSASGLAYTWTLLSAPAGGTASFSVNGSASAASTVASFSKPGAYAFRVTAGFQDDASWPTITSDLAVTVQSTGAALAVTPAVVDVSVLKTRQFTALEFDQFGVVSAIQPAFAWSASGAGSIDTAGLFSAAGVGGAASVTVSHGGLSRTVDFMVAGAVPVNAPPTVASAATAATVAVSGSTVELRVLGADDGGEPALTYSWSTISGPSASVAFSASGSNAAKVVTATFPKAGSYQFFATLTDAGGLSATSAVTVTVQQTPSALSLTPGSAVVTGSGTQAFLATGLDQFGDTLAPLPALAWTVSGGGSISPSGVFTAGSTAGGTFIVTASGAALSATASVAVTVNQAAPRLQTIIDNGAVRDVLGMWPISTTALGFIGTGWSDLSSAAGSYGVNSLSALPGFLAATATYRPTLNQAADYAIEVWYPEGPAANRSPAVPVEVSSTLGMAALVLDQTSGAATWKRLGAYPLAAGTGSSVVIRGAATGFARADAVRFSPIPTFTTPATVGAITGKAAALNAAATFQGSGADLAYKWSLRSGPPGGTATFTPSGGGSGGTTATCSLSGAYVFQVEVGFAGEPAWPGAISAVNVAVTVNQAAPRLQTIIDNGAVRDVPGMWPISTTALGFIGTGWSDLSSAAGSYGVNSLSALPGFLAATATYRPTLNQAADYAIEVWYPSVPPANRSPAVPLEITSTLGTVALILDQTSEAGIWKRLGTYPLEAGTGGSVVIRGSATGSARADAVRFSPVPTFSAPAAGIANGATVALSATATFAGSSQGISYTWSVRSGPPGGSATFSTAAPGSELVVANCSRNGTYIFQVQAGFLDEPGWPKISSEVTVGVSGAGEGGGPDGDAVNALVAWGDSMTAYGTGDWVERAALALNIPKANRGVSGNSPTHIRDRMVADARSATDSHRAWNTVIWAGQVDTSQWRDALPDRSKPQAVLNVIATMVAELGHGRYRILEVTPRRDEAGRWNHGAVVRNHLDWFNQRLATIYGQRFIWLLPALQAASNGGANDAADVAAGLIPRSLMTDNVHLTSSWLVKPGATTAGNNVVLNQFLASVPNRAAWDILPHVGLGSIEREYWAGVPGTSVASIPLSAAPTGVTALSRLEGPIDAGELYGARIRGTLTAPTAGLYTFWLAASDTAELWLSTDDQPARRVRIAQVAAPTGRAQWDAGAGQKSLPIRLTVGIRYYIEVLHKASVGADHVAVGWAKPGESTAGPSQVVPGSALSPAVPSSPGGAG